MTEKLREKMANGDPFYGLYISLADPTTIELAAMAGFDMIRIDLEHSLFSQSELRELIRTSTALNLPVFVRVPSLSYVTALLDMGASGIIAPNIDSREAALEAIREVKYAPQGLRGMAGSQRNTKYGMIPLPKYAASANEDVLLCIQIESKKGIENIDEILALDGIDMVSSGRHDISQSYGLPGQNTHPLVLAAEETVLSKAIATGRYPVLLISSKKRRDELMQKGVRGFMVGRDSLLLRDAMKNTLAAYKEEPNT